MSEDKFLDRLRADARSLRYEIDDVAATRLRARVRSRLAESQPSVLQFIASWSRPLAASLAAVGLVATIGLAVYESEQSVSFTGPVEVSMGGVTYSVVE